MTDLDCAMVFLPTMEQLRLNIKHIAINKSSAELMNNLQDNIMASVGRAPFNIPEEEFDLDDFNLVDTNLTVISDLTYYFTIPQNQLALFILHTESVQEGLAKKACDPQFKFNAFVHELAQRQKRAVADGVPFLIKYGAKGT